MTMAPAAWEAAWPRWWRWTVVALGTLLLSACSSLSQPGPSPVEPPGPRPPRAVAGEHSPALPRHPAHDCQTPLPDSFCTDWSPPGLAGPWPPDEYLHDGGDREVPASVGQDWRINGLETEDTIAHYDTIDGERVVVTSNRVSLYAPRFAAVRKVEGVVQDLQQDQVVQATLPLKPNQHDDLAPPTVATQPLAPRGQVTARGARTARRKQPEGRLANEQSARAVQDAFLPFENFQVIRLGTFDLAEQVRLLESVDAAIAWSHDRGAQVVLNRQLAVAETGTSRAQLTYRIDTPNSPRLRLIKVASTSTALPGEVVEFTLRFDNLGDQTIGNVTIVDNLTPRLEYVAGTAQSSRTADFSTQQNEGDALVLRWELTEPLKPGAGGVLRFNCRVR